MPLTPNTGLPHPDPRVASSRPPPAASRSPAALLRNTLGVVVSWLVFCGADSAPPPLRGSLGIEVFHGLERHPGNYSSPFHRDHAVMGEKSGNEMIVAVWKDI